MLVDLTELWPWGCSPVRPMINAPLVLGGRHFWQSVIRAIPCTFCNEIGKNYFANFTNMTRACIYIDSGGTEVTVTGSNLDSVAEPRINLTVVITKVNNNSVTSTSSSEVIC